MNETLTSSLLLPVYSNCSQQSNIFKRRAQRPQFNLHVAQSIPQLKLNPDQKFTQMTHALAYSRPSFLSSKGAHHITRSSFVSSYQHLLWRSLQVTGCASNLTRLPGRYRRSLPYPSISLYPAEGKRLFDEATTLGTAAGFLEIATNLVTQKELTYCGLSSLTTILNALFIDPQDVWKGSWRWYDENMLVNTEKLKKIEVQGLSFQGLIDLVPRDKVNLQATFATESSLQEFREHLFKSCSSNTSYILANYSRSALGQTGKGHFSPVAAYNPSADAALLLDVARFKYPPHWVPSSNLWEAMAAKINPTSRKSRGFMIISKL